MDHTNALLDARTRYWDLFPSKVDLDGFEPLPSTRPPEDDPEAADRDPRNQYYAIADPPVTGLFFTRWTDQSRYWRALLYVGVRHEAVEAVLDSFYEATPIVRGWGRRHTFAGHVTNFGLTDVPHRVYSVDDVPAMLEATSRTFDLVRRLTHECHDLERVYDWLKARARAETRAACAHVLGRHDEGLEFLENRRVELLARNRFSPWDEAMIEWYRGLA